MQLDGPLPAELTATGSDSARGLGPWSGALRRFGRRRLFLAQIYALAGDAEFRRTAAGRNGPLAAPGPRPAGPALQLRSRSSRGGSEWPTPPIGLPSLPARTSSILRPRHSIDALEDEIDKPHPLT